MKPLVDVNGAAAVLGVSSWTVRAHIRKGNLRPVRIGRRVLLEEAELQQFVTDNKDGSEPKREGPER